MDYNNFRTGDLIVREKGPFSTHYIVWIGGQNGIRVVAENQSGVGVRYASLEEALAGNAVTRFEKFGGSEEQRYLVVPKINELLGKSYDLVVFNCEHFARWICNGKIESKQVGIASNLALLGGAAMLTSKNNVMKGIGALSIVAVVLGHMSQQ